MKFIKQLDEMDCGPTCLKMVLESYNHNVSINRLRQLCSVGKTGVTMKELSKAADFFCLRTVVVKISYNKENGIPGFINMNLPAIAHYNQNHFIVVYKINKSHVWIADPAHEKIKLSKEQFEKSWCSDGDKGIVLGLEPTPEFYRKNLYIDKDSSNSWSSLFQYLRPYRRLIIQFVIGIIAGLLFQVMFPFLTQSLIDVGVQNQNLNFVWLILIAQLVLFTSQTFVQFIQSWIILQIGKRINVNLISDFLSKLMKLPLGYFDSKNVGDLVQRINDNYRVEQFLTGSVLNIVFSFLTLIVFSGILLFYDLTIFLVFAFFSTLYVLWVLLFMKKRAKIDSLRFNSNQTINIPYLR